MDRVINKEKSKLILQFNEANFDIIYKYVQKYQFHSLKKFLNRSKEIYTTSEEKYENLEPWIQWYSFYSGKEYDKHGIYHLGDCLKKHHNLFSEQEAIKGKSVGVFGSMNMPPSKYYNIYIPDPWTNAKSDNSLSSRIVSSTMRQIINSNIKLNISLQHILGLCLLIGFPKSIIDIKMIFKSLLYFFTKSRENLASIFDYFFVKHSIKRILDENLDLSLIFLNGFAHVQHHYFLSSEFVNGKNPYWYVKKGNDPLYK